MRLRPALLPVSRTARVRCPFLTACIRSDRSQRGLRPDVPCFDVLPARQASLQRVSEQTRHSVTLRKQSKLLVQRLRFPSFPESSSHLDSASAARGGNLADFKPGQGQESFSAALCDRALGTTPFARSRSYSRCLRRTATYVPRYTPKYARRVFPRGRRSVKIHPIPGIYPRA